MLYMKLFTQNTVHIQIQAHTCICKRAHSHIHTQVHYLQKQRILTRDTIESSGIRKQCDKHCQSTKQVINISFAPCHIEFHFYNYSTDI